MAWGGNTGGGFGGGIGGAPIGGSAGAARGFGAARPEGLPFAGIPPEIEGHVEKLLEHEPDHSEPDVSFTHKVVDRRPLTMRRLFKPYTAAVALCALIVVVEVACLQS